MGYLDLHRIDAEKRGLIQLIVIEQSVPLWGSKHVILPTLGKYTSITYFGPLDPKGTLTIQEDRRNSDRGLSGNTAEDSPCLGCCSGT